MSIIAKTGELFYMNRIFKNLLLLSLSASILTSCSEQSKPSVSDSVLKTELNGDTSQMNYEYDFYEIPDVFSIHSCEKGIIFDSVESDISEKTCISVYNTESGETSELPLENDIFLQYESYYISKVEAHGDIIMFCGMASEHNEIGKIQEHGFIGWYNLKSEENKISEIDDGSIYQMSYDSKNRNIFCMTLNNFYCFDADLNITSSAEINAKLGEYIDLGELHSISSASSDGDYYLSYSSAETKFLFKMDRFFDVEWKMTKDELSEFNNNIAVGTLKDDTLIIYSYDNDGDMWFVNEIDKNSSETLKRYEFNANGKEIKFNASDYCDYILISDKYFELYNTESGSPVSTCLFDDCECLIDESSVYANGNIYSVVFPHEKSERIGKIMDKNGEIKEKIEINGMIKKGDLICDYQSSSIYSWDRSGLVICQDGPDKSQRFYVENHGNFDLCGVTSDFLFGYECDFELYSSDGVFIRQFSIDGEMAAFTDKSGNDEIYYFDDRKKLMVYDVSGEKVTEVKPVNEIIGTNSNAYVYYDGGIHDFYIELNNTLYSYDIGDDSVQIIVPDMSGFLFNRVSGIIVLDNDGNMACSSPDGIYIIKPAAEKDDYKIIEIAAVGIENGIPYEIINSIDQKNDSYKINVKKYDSYDKLDLDISRGHISDIILTGDAASSEKYEKMNMFADLTAFIENDSEIDDRNYFMNLFDIYKTNNKLFKIFSHFSISTMFISDDTKPDYNDIVSFCNYADSEKMSIVKDNSFSDDILEVFLHGYILDQKKNSNGDINFNTESFMSLLNCINNNCTDYAERKIILPVHLNSFYSAVKIINEYEPDFLAAGYPGNGQNYSYIVPDVCYSISEQCKDKDTAWDIVKTIFVNTAAIEDISFSVNRNVYAKNKSSISEFEKMNSIIEEIDNIIESTGVRYENDKIINGIVFEEIQKYYSEEESFEQTADNIQTRVNLYLNETR